MVFEFYTSHWVIFEVSLLEKKVYAKGCIKWPLGPIFPGQKFDIWGHILCAITGGRQAMTAIFKNSARNMKF